MANIKYFNGTDELTRIQPLPNAKFQAIGGFFSRSNYYDGFQRLVGVNSAGKLVPVERAITYKQFPSRHECNAKCLNGKHNGICECKCGGKNHGAGMFTKLLQAA